jgi:hypothetical protein
LCRLRGGDGAQEDGACLLLAGEAQGELHGDFGGSDSDAGGDGVGRRGLAWDECETVGLEGKISQRGLEIEDFDCDWLGVEVAMVEELQLNTEARAAGTHHARLGGDAFAAAHLTAAGRWAPHAAAAHASGRGASGSAHHTATSSAWPMFRRTVAVGTSGGAVAEAACDDQAREDASAEEGLFSL